MFGADLHYSIDLRGTNVTSATGTAGPKQGGGSAFLAGNSLLFSCASQFDCGKTFIERDFIRGFFYSCVMPIELRIS